MRLRRLLSRRCVDDARGAAGPLLIRHYLVSDFREFSSRHYQFIAPAKIHVSRLIETHITAAIDAYNITRRVNDVITPRLLNSGHNVDGRAYAFIIVATATCFTPWHTGRIYFDR